MAQKRRGCHEVEAREVQYSAINVEEDHSSHGCMAQVMQLAQDRNGTPLAHSGETSTITQIGFISAFSLGSEFVAQVFANNIPAMRYRGCCHCDLQPVRGEK